MEELAEKGKELFKGKKYAESLDKFTAALKLLLASGDTILYLKRLADCFASSSQDAGSLLFSSAAATVSNPLGVDASDFFLTASHGIVRALKAMGKAREAATISKSIRVADNEYWAAHAELMVAATSAMRQDEVAMSIMQLSIAPLVALMRAKAAKPVAVTMPSVAEAEHRATLIAEGDALFREGKSCIATESYTSALRLGRPADFAATTLRNMGMCSAKLGKSSLGFAYLTASLYMDPTSLKSVYHLSKCLLDADALEEAFSLCAAAADLPLDSHSSRDLSGLLDTIQRARKIAEHVVHGEKDVDQLGGQNQTNLEQMKMMDIMNNVLLQSPKGRSALTKSGLLPRTDLPRLHEELKDSRRLPRGCDQARSLDLFELAYRNATLNDSHLTTLVGDLRDKNADMYKRWGGGVMNDAAFQKWYNQAGPGSTFLDPGVCVPLNHIYIPGLLQAFSNSPNRPEKLVLGKVHVAVGFVDLGSLLWGDLVREDEGDLSPLRWVGYELSAYCTAKTLIIAEMLTDDCPTTAILQVWFSSLWMAPTLEAFRRATLAVIRKFDRVPLSSEVRKLLYHWSESRVSPELAMKRWLETATDHCMSVINLVRKQDRVAMMRYLTTGDLLGGPHGSVVMFANPKGRLAQDLNFLQCIYFQTLAKEWLKASVSDIVQAGVNLVSDRIDVLALLCQAGKVTIQAIHHSVGLDSPETLGEISALEPYTMSWSNVCDYFHPRDFFAIARRCSAKGKTTHYAYSMNWVQGMYGTNVLDYDPKLRENIVTQGQEIITKFTYLQNLKYYCRLPLIDNQINVASVYLERKYYESWIELFFSHGSLGSKQRRAAMSHFNHLARTSSTCFLLFTFDEAIRFREKEYE